MQRVDQMANTEKVKRKNYIISGYLLTIVSELFNVIIYCNIVVK